MVQARAGPFPAARCATKPSSQPGGSVSRAARCAARTKGRSGRRCQHAEHKPSPSWRLTCPHCVHWRGGSLGWRGREHGPHQPVSSRRYPGRPHRGQGRWAAACRALRRQSRHRAASWRRTGWPHRVQVREHSTHRPVSDWRIRCFPHPGHVALAAASVIFRQHRQQCSRPMMPTGAPQPAQSRCFFPIGSALVREAASTGPGLRLSAAPAPDAVAGRGGPRGWCRPRTSR